MTYYTYLDQNYTYIYHFSSVHIVLDFDLNFFLLCVYGGGCLFVNIADRVCVITGQPAFSPIICVCVCVCVCVYECIMLDNLYTPHGKKMHEYHSL